MLYIGVQVQDAFEKSRLFIFFFFFPYFPSEQHFVEEKYKTIW